MKKILLTAIVLAMGVAVLHAQDDKKFHERKRMHKGMHGMMTEKLNLSQEQKDKMKSINEDFRKQMADLKKNEDITVKEMKSRREAISKDHKAKIQGLLTNDQKAQIEKNKQERKAKMEAGEKGRFEKMKTNLGLTEAQSAQLEKNRKASMEKMKAIREDKSLSDEQKKEQAMQIRKKQKEEMKSILTEEQLKKLKERKPGKEGKRKITR